MIGMAVRLLIRNVALKCVVLALSLVFSRCAEADLTIVAQVSVTGLNSNANGGVTPPAFPLTFTNYFQGDKSRLESSDGSVIIVDGSSGLVYQLNSTNSTYRVESLKKLEDFTNAFPKRFAKRLSISDDLNFLPATDTATFMNVQTTKTNVTGAAHLLVSRPESGDGDGGGDDTGFPGGQSGQGGDPSGGGLPLTRSSSGYPVYPDPSTSDPTTGTAGPGDPGAGDNGPGGPYGPNGDPRQGGDNGEGVPSRTGGDNGGDGGSDKSGSGTSTDHPRQEGGYVRRTNLPTYYVTGVGWESTTFKLPKTKHSIAFPLCLQMIWAGGPFVTDLVSQLDHDRELPLHSEFTIQQSYDATADNANILLNNTIVTTFDVKSISTAPIDSTLFTVPQTYTKDPSPISEPQLSAPYMKSGPEEPPN
jgi:hypothetical protein